MGRGEMTPEGVVEGAMATIEAGADGADLVVLLDEYCAAFVTTDLIQRGTPGMLPSRVWQAARRSSTFAFSRGVAGGGGLAATSARNPAELSANRCSHRLG